MYKPSINYGQFLFQIITDNNENLRCINLSGCKCITNELLSPIFQRNSRLHTVDLSECHHLTDGCIQQLTDLCEELKRYVNNADDTKAILVTYSKFVL